MTEDEQALGDRLRADRQAFETELAAAFREHPGQLADACLSIAEADVDVVGWDQLDADLHRVQQEGVTVTAVGLDLSNYGDGDEPVVEVALYDDTSFPFSSASPGEIAEAGRRYAAPWTGRFNEGDATPLGTVGLGAVNGPLRQGEGVEGPPEQLAWWWQHLRFQQAVARRLRDHGLALVVPVVTGGHSFGPWFVDVHVPSRVSDHLATSERLMAEREQAQHDGHDDNTQRVVDNLYELKRLVGQRGVFSKRNGEVERWADAAVVNMERWAGVPERGKPLARMNAADIERLVASYRASRARS